MRPADPRRRMVEEARIRMQDLRPVAGRSRSRPRVSGAFAAGEGYTWGARWFRMDGPWFAPRTFGISTSVQWSPENEDIRRQAHPSRSCAKYLVRRRRRADPCSGGSGSRADAGGGDPHFAGISRSIRIFGGEILGGPCCEKNTPERLRPKASRQHSAHAGRGLDGLGDCAMRIRPAEVRLKVLDQRRARPCRPPIRDRPAMRAAATLSRSHAKPRHSVTHADLLRARGRDVRSPKWTEVRERSILTAGDQREVGRALCAEMDGLESFWRAAAPTAAPTPRREHRRAHCQYRGKIPRLDWKSDRPQSRGARARRAGPRKKGCCSPRRRTATSSAAP